jgi:heme/copper-type cytochrome/quinol oxidase subunit 2
LKRILSVVPAFVIAGIFLQVCAVAAIHARESPQHSKPKAEQSPTVITLTATDLHFEPSVIHLTVDERYELQVTSPDSTRGIRISPFPNGGKANTPPGLSFPSGEDCWKLQKGETVLIGIVPTEPGTYTYSCCKACGKAQKKMTGRIIVDR